MGTGIEIDRLILKLLIGPGSVAKIFYNNEIFILKNDPGRNGQER
jgi:hypothetical protein